MWLPPPCYRCRPRDVQRLCGSNCFRSRVQIIIVRAALDLIGRIVLQPRFANVDGHGTDISGSMADLRLSGDGDVLAGRQYEKHGGDDDKFEMFHTLNRRQLSRDCGGREIRAGGVCHPSFPKRGLLCAEVVADDGWQMPPVRERPLRREHHIVMGGGSEAVGYDF